MKRRMMALLLAGVMGVGMMSGAAEAANPQTAEKS